MRWCATKTATYSIDGCFVPQTAVVSTLDLGPEVLGALCKYQPPICKIRYENNIAAKRAKMSLGVVPCLYASYAVLTKKLVNTRISNELLSFQIYENYSRCSSEFQF